jgi:hypothetical protein
VQITGWPVDNITAPFIPADLSGAAGSGLIGFTYATSYAIGSIGRWLKDLATSVGSTFIGFLQAGGGAILRTLQSKGREYVSIEDFGGVGDGITNNDDALWNAIISLRQNGVVIQRDIGGGATVTAYSSGIVNFGPGVFVVSPDLFEITQDLGLQFKGRGSRRTNNSVRAATTLLFSGTSAGFGIKLWDNGARGFIAEDMDFCYADSSFTGDIIDSLNCPGLSLNRCFVGTFGITAPTRLQTARSVLRSTYDEFIHCTNCVFDGAIDGWWSDDARVQNANTFGGSMTKFDSCVFYDFTNRPIRHDGLRTRAGVKLVNTIINPISVDCQRGVDLTNVEGVSIDGGGFAGSVANNAVVEWMRLANCTGSVTDVFFDDNSKAGTVGGVVSITGNRVFATDGLTLTDGAITGYGNEFSQGTNGFTISAASTLSFNLGPDFFKVGVTRSYDVPVDSANLSGRILYDRANDASVSKFRNVSNRVNIQGLDEKAFEVTDAAYAVSALDTGRTVLANGGAAQVFTLPDVAPGTTLIITKISAQNLQINCAAGDNFYGRGSSFPVSASLAGAAMGTLVLEAYSTIGWIVKTEVNTWTYV